MSNTAENIREITVSQPASSGALTPMDMLGHAVERGADLDMIEKLMGLQERWEKNQARKSFDEAIAAAKKEIPVIVRNATGHNSKRYADFAAIAKTVDPILGQHGLSYRFRTVQTEKAITVTCVLFGHGHSEETSLSGPADASGSKNAIQAIGSTLTYLQRYSLVQMLGLAAADDDDGKASHGGATITEDQAADLVALADDVGADRAKFCKYFKVESFSALPASRFQAAVDALNAKRKA
jgi:hypothetical protein